MSGNSGTTPTEIPPQKALMLVKHGLGACCCGSTDDSPAAELVRSLIHLAGAELVVSNEEDGNKELLHEITAAEEKLIEEFLRHPPRSRWLGTQDDVLSVVSELGVLAAQFADPRMRSIVLRQGARLSRQAHCHKDG